MAAGSRKNCCAHPNCGGQAFASLGQLCMAKRHGQRVGRIRRLRNLREVQK
jgi:hypothetical protein